MKRFNTIILYSISAIVFSIIPIVTRGQEYVTENKDTSTVEETEEFGIEEEIAIRGITPGTSVPNHISVDTSRGVGQIPISSGVSPSGAKTYLVPIDLPQGVNGLRPDISLCYNSQQGNSALGSGWGISGLSQISRGTKSLYYDGTTAGVKLDTTDVFFLDGMRLVNTGHESNYLLYETETGHIKAKGYLSGDAIVYFDVFYPNGRRGTFGFTSNTANQLYYPQTSLTDPFNNSITYAYTYAGAHYYVNTVSYNGASIVFQYQDTRPDPTQAFCAGREIEEQKLLNSISCKFGSNTIGTYILSYTTSFSGRSLLSRIDYEAGGASFNPILFYYKSEQGSSAHFTQSSAQLSEWHPSYNPNLIRTLRGRLNYHRGTDGILSCINKNPYIEVANTPNKFFINGYDHTSRIYVYDGLDGAAPELTRSITLEKGFVDVLCAALDGTMNEDIIRVNDTVIGSSDRLSFSVYRMESSDLNLRYTRSYNFPTVIQDGPGHKSIQPKFFFTGDFNGDGKMEVMAVSAHQPLNSTTLTSKCYIFALEEDQILFQDDLVPYHRQFVGSNITDSHVAENNSDKVIAMDYDGDGKTDLVYIGPTGMSIYTFEGSGSSLTARLVSSANTLTRPGLANRILLPGDFNGDGLTDILVSPSSEVHDPTWGRYLSKGDGTFSYSTFEGFINNGSDYEGFMGQDINGDGRSDLVAYRTGGFEVLLATAGGFSSDIISESAPNTFMTLIPASVNSGDRLTSLIGLKQYTVTKYTYNHPLQHESIIIGMANSLGVIERNSYELMTDNDGSYVYDSASSQTAFPYVSFHERIPLATSTEIRLDNRVIDQNTYSYVNAVVHRQGLGFRGFERVIQTNHRGQETIQSFDPTRFGVPTSVSSPSHEGAYDFSVTIQGNRLAEVQLASKTETDLLKNVTSTTTYSYDGYGFPTSENTTYSDGTTVGRQYTYEHYPSLGTGYHLGYLLRQSATTTKEGASYVEMAYMPSSNSQHVPDYKYLYKDGHVVWTAHYLYDSHGNVTSESTKDYYSSHWHEYSRSYDFLGRLLQETDPIGLTTSYAYDNNGRISAVTDPRGGTTSYTYDDFGRVTSTTEPDGTVRTTTRAWNSSVTGGLFALTHTETGKPKRRTIYDALGRELRISNMRFDGQYQHIDKVYDEYGNLQSESYPFKGSMANKWKSWTYDEHGRVVEDIYGQGMINAIEYDGLSVVTYDNNNRSTTRTYDVLGNLISVTDEAGTTTYHIAPDGQPDSITAPGGVTTSFTYDVYRRRKSIIGPSAGTASYAYDVSGNIIRETDSRGRSIRYNYDQHNRLTTTTRPEFTTTRTYNSYGDLVSVSSTNGTFREMTYDDYGRLNFIREGIDNTWLDRYYFYSNGRVDSIQYSTSTGFQASENYIYAYGHWIKGLLNGHVQVYELKEENGLGQPTHVETLSVDRTYSYSPYGLPAGRSMNLQVVLNPYRLSAFDPAHQNCLNHTYTFDQATATLTSRTDNLRHLTETFSYDGLYRLTSYGNATATYDAKGNLTSKSDVGTFSYDHPQKPYAISAAAMTATGIDTAPQDITYTSFHRPDSIVQGNCTSTFVYNDDGQRMLMSTYKTIGNHVNTSAKYYLGNCYEESGFTHDLYLFGSYYDAPVVLRKETRFDVYSMQYITEEKLYYILRDYLGSIVKVISEDGTAVQDVSYDAWGRLRNPSTLQPYAAGSEPTLFLGRGYCGHEHLQTYGLINMNARLYDPIVGRFLSPDPYVQMPDNSQSFNRYSYALNNPLKYVDEDGEWFVELLLAMGSQAVIGALQGGVGYSVSAAINKEWSWNDFGTTVAFGAVSGAIGGLSNFVASTFLPAGIAANQIGYSFMSNTFNHYITNAIFKRESNWKDIFPLISTSLISAITPNYEASQANGFLNTLKEIGFNTAKGTLAGFYSGIVDAGINKDLNRLWQDAVGGAVSGASRTLALNLILGAPYKPEVELEYNGLYRSGGIASWFSGYGNGLTIGRNVYVDSKYDVETEIHENYHLYQISKLGFSSFYGLIIGDYIKYLSVAGIDGRNHPERSLEYDAYHGKDTHIMMIKP